MKESRKKLNRLISTAIVSCMVMGASYENVLALENKSQNNSEKVVKYDNEAEYIKNIRLRWKEDLVGNSSLDTSNATISKKIISYTNNTDKLVAKLNMDPNAQWLWEDLKDYKQNPARITSMFNNLVTMSMAYSLPNNKYYKNEDLKNKIIYSLDWINKNAYNENIDQYGNWWDWMIGIPARLNNIVVLMYDDLTEEQVKNYMNAIQKFLPSIEPGSKYHTGANLADVCMNKLLQGVNENDPEKIKEASEDIVGVFDYVTSGDGFYKDGSYLQHGMVAYTGSYGNVLIEKISNIMFLLEKTPWSIKSESKDNVYKWIFESFNPIIYKGYVMDMVRGRAISRYNANGYLQASGIIEGMIKIGMISDGDKASEINALVKKWATEAKSVLDFGARFKSINVIGEFYGIMNNDNIKPLEEGDKHYALNSMDKTVHKRENFALGISRSSSRISKYEFMNKENLTPWFQGDGMTYLFNNDLNQFSGNFWATVDPYRMPGTTVDTRKREPKEILPGLDPGASQQNEIYYELGKSNWSGGSKLGAYGVAGMEIDNKYDSLKAKKSWFMFDDEIVALGSGITNPEDFETETIVENRKIKSDGSNKFIVDGKERVSKLKEKDKVDNAKWAYLEGNVSGSNIGYYFPEGANINLIKDEREGNWINVNSSKPEADKVVKDNYLTMYIDHGKAIKDQKYSYVLLPNKTEDKVKEYSENPNVEIIQNDDVAHSVKHKKLNIEAANFWKEGKNTAGNITSTGKSSIIIKENKDNTLSIAVSDPTFLEKNLSIEINKPAMEVIKSDKRISNINLENGKIKFDANTENLSGAPLELLVKLGDKNNGNNENNNEIKNEAPVIEGEDANLFVGDKWDKSLHKLKAKDKEDGDLTKNIKIKDNQIPLNDQFEVTKPGTYPVTFEVSDNNGKKAEKKLNVLVKEKEENKPENKPENQENKPEIKPEIKPEDQENQSTKPESEENKGENPQANNNTEKLPNTGGASNLSLGAIGVLLATVGTMFTKKRKK
ncbi:polysaccharide lyase family 8 super-sandwich domain-containing protein [Clostridium perfringens]|uniref:polysaccharide lyase family 8 super-sandwich domain-containing protein n=3 Tax=Clostridium perfringens TaxID=1502 RepID=UPI0018E4D55E|nr:polysaccharide lyase family 8 super-sandwich domain-containing protein [Clostridium perfringens]MBI6050698.1 LPXTG cell wall anchor domain-containing protein [Clostridium perfringens]MDK0732984.1 polysaccharide lyase family 8 super-sandwich domain-containing protein [Clostridium perfringens]MDK0871686.1 polysaccharide lyase family 8 super-sandwich domain-containing protein [Clostridium perfringens]